MKSLPRRKRTGPRKTKSSTRTRKDPRRSGKKRKSFRPSDPSLPIAYLGLGSNLGDRRARLESALSEIARLAPLRKVSSFYRSDPVGFTGQPDFVNAVVEVSWDGTPESLLEAVREIERRIGRTTTFRNGPREIDVDILDLGGLVRGSPDPILPHPRLSSRRFALAPLAEINPSWVHPVTGRTARELLETLPARPAARRLAKRRRTGR